MAQPTKNRFIDHLAEGNDAESFFAAGQRNDARATILARSACTILQAATAKLRFRAGAERHRASIARLRSRRRETDLAPGGRSVRCSLLNQQAFRLEKKFEMDHGFHRTPLVPGCLEALQYVSQAWPGRELHAEDVSAIRYAAPVEPEPDVKELIRANADTLLTRVLARSPSRGPSASPGAASAFA
jgi:hypothetical protein